MMQNNQVSPRLLTPADAPAAAAVEAACFARPWSEASLRGSLESPCGLFVGLWQGERLIGYAGMHLVLGEGAVDNVAILPQYRGLGLGRALMQAFLQQAALRGCRRVTLEVRPSNTAARRLYASLGFAEEGLRRDFYDGPREDALLCGLDLN